jgi:hypothetical protein
MSGTQQRTHVRLASQQQREHRPHTHTHTPTHRHPNRNQVTMIYQPSTPQREGVQENTKNCSQLHGSEMRVKGFFFCLLLGGWLFYARQRERNWKERKSTKKKRRCQSERGFSPCFFSLPPRQQPTTTAGAQHHPPPPENHGGNRRTAECHRCRVRLRVPRAGAVVRCRARLSPACGQGNARTARLSGAHPPRRAERLPCLA